jgi:uncharacterized membrane protein YbhN (UPF0104 family)
MPQEPNDVVELGDLGPSAAAAAGEIAGRWRTVTWARRFATLTVLGAVISILLLNAKRSESAFAAIAHARPWWVGAVVAATFVTYVMAAASTIGSTPVRLGLSRTFVMQVASSFVNRFVPGGVAGAVLNVRFVERSGASRSAAIVSNVLNNVAGFTIHVALFLALLPTFGGVHRDVDPPDDFGVFVAVLVVLVAVGAAVWIRWIPHHLKGRVAPLVGAASDVVRSPPRLVLLVGGSAGVTVAHGLGLWCALRAVGAPVALSDVMIVYLAAAAAATISPTPGGLGAIEIALVAGLSQTGIPAAPALAAVLVYRLVSYWLPIVPGLLAYRWLRRRAAV